MSAADVSRSVALIGCRSIQLRPEAFWSARVDNVLWKSKLNERFRPAFVNWSAVVGQVNSCSLKAIGSLLTVTMLHMQNNRTKVLNFMRRYKYGGSWPHLLLDWF